MELSLPFQWHRRVQTQVKQISTLLIVSTLGLVLISIGYRLYEVGSIPGVNGDEALMTVQVTEMTAGRPVILKMPTGRMLSPVYGSVLLLTETFFRNSFETLRSPAFLSGILAVFLAFFWFRKSLGVWTGLFSALFLATFPVAIAYSRVGIEQCLIPLSTLWVVHCSFQGKFRAWLLSFFVSLLVHPVDVFLVPFCAMILGARILSDPRWSKQQKQGFLVGAVALLVLAIFAEFFLLPSHYQELLAVPQILYRLRDFAGMSEYLLHFLRLFSGVTAYEQYVGRTPGSLTLVLDMVWGVGLLVLTVVGSWRLFLEKKWVELASVVGFYAMAVGFYLVTGLFAITPGVARYALFLLAPGAVVFAILIRSLVAGERSHRWSVIGVSLYSWLTLLCFAQFYFHDFKVGNSDAHRTYLSGTEEPKAAALSWIKNDAKSKPDKPLLVLAEDWWTYWPLRYLMIPTANSQILHYLTPEDQIQNFPMRQELRELSEVKRFFEMGGYGVGFPGGPMERTLRQLFSQGVQVKAIPGYGGKNILHVYTWKGRS